MRVHFGLDLLLAHVPTSLRNKRVGVLCHAPSITSDYTHIIDALISHDQIELAAIFGPQHGLFGQTQDNMIEWEGGLHPLLKVPVHSLYGQTRKPTPEMLRGLDALVIDVQDVGARPYTYIWTIKLCMEACTEQGLPLWILDRPNPIGALDFDGPLLSPDYFSFVGGATIPLCHRMTIGEMAELLKAHYFPRCDLNVIWMQGWWRNSLWHETGLPWVLPSPNMPTQDTAIVYPGMVLLEATNMSEGRGTTRPFEIIGAPYVDTPNIITELRNQENGGCLFREHGFIPTFQKWRGEPCNGFQVHVTDPRSYLSVTTTVSILAAVIRYAQGRFAFKPPPYEYETVKMPFDILAGDDNLRLRLDKGDIEDIHSEWRESYSSFLTEFQSVARYPEDPQ